MFKRFFTALASLSAAVEALTATVLEARDNFRSNLGLDHDEAPAELAHEPAAGRSKKKTT